MNIIYMIILNLMTSMQLNYQNINLLIKVFIKEIGRMELNMEKDR